MLGYVCYNEDKSVKYAAFSNEDIAKAAWRLSYSRLAGLTEFHEHESGDMKVTKDRKLIGWIVIAPVLSCLDRVDHL